MNEIAKPDSIGVIDLFHDRLAPDLHSRHDIILKCTINNSHSLRDHQRSFRPDVSILFVRDPVQNAIRLSTKDWKEWSGTVDEKLALMNGYLKNWKEHFDFVVTYEDFLYRRAAVVDAFLDTTPDMAAIDRDHRLDVGVPRGADQNTKFVFDWKLIQIHSLTP